MVKMIMASDITDIWDATIKYVNISIYRGAVVV